MTNFYTIKTVSQKTGLKISTLHYYEKVGLLPNVQRDSNGHRQFTDHDFEWIEFLKCMKKTGMPLDSIRRFATYHRKKGNLSNRLAILQEHQLRMEAQMKQLTAAMEFINKKINMFEKALERYPAEA